LFPKVIPLRLFAVGEVALSQDEPLSVDFKMVPDVPTITNISGTDVMVNEVIVSEPLKFVFEFLVVIVLETLIVQSVYVPSLREFKMIVLLPEIAMVVLEEHEPP
jgi:hypothetical protein